MDSETRGQAVKTVLLRVWVPDRPGALGAVASRVGAVGGDVVGIDILERGAGRAIDELWIELTELDQIPLLVTEVAEVDGVDVEDCRPVDIARRSATLYAFDGALDLLELSSAASVLDRMANLAVEACSAEGAVVVAADGSSEEALVAGFEGEDAAWLIAFARGVAVSSDGRAIDATSFPDLAVGVLERSGQLLVVSRRGLIIRDKERRIIGDIARAADHRLAELG